MYRTEDFTRLRLWDCGQDADITLDDVETVFKDLAIAIGDSKVYVWTDTVDAKKELGISEYPVLRIRHENSAYLPIFVMLFQQGNNTCIAMGTSGKGEQIKAPELQKLYVQAAGSVYNTYAMIKHSANMGRSLTARLGGSGRGAAISAGLVTATGAAVAGSIKLAVKGIKALMRDREAYEREMGFYTFALGMGDYLIGGTDSNDCFGSLLRHAKDGNVTAQYLMGNAYLEGRGTEADFDKAIQWFDTAAANGHEKSQDLIAGEYLFGEKNYSLEQKETAVKYLILMADREDSDAMDILLQIYGKGEVEGIPADLHKALEFAEKFSKTGNLMAKMMIAQASDHAYLDEDGSLADYKNDERAAGLYQELVAAGNADYVKIAAYNLGCMYQTGRGVTQSAAEAVHYLKMAYENGEREAAGILLQYYLKGDFPEASSVKRICQDIISNGDAELLPIAYYCQFRIADNREQYRDSMAYAKKYLACANAEEEKKAEVQKYLDEKEAQISSMSEEERMAFFHEKKPMFYDLKKLVREKGWSGFFKDKRVILVLAVIAAMIVAGVLIAVFAGNSSDEDFGEANDYVAEEPVDDVSASDYSSVMGAYDEFLSQSTIEVEDSRVWNSSNCDFSLPYISNNDVPELMIYDFADNDHASGYGALFEYRDGEVKLVGTLSLNDVRKIGYYEGTGYLMDHYAATGYGTIIIKHINDLRENDGAKNDMFEIDLEYDYDDMPQITGYAMGIPGNQGIIDASESEFYERLREDTQHVNMTDYKFFHNTEEERSEAFSDYE